MRHRPFVKFELKKRWGKIHRVFIGKDRVRLRRQIQEWCSESGHRWYCSDGYECYYFDDEHTAVHCRLRWAGLPTDAEFKKN